MNNMLYKNSLPLGLLLGLILPVATWLTFGYLKPDWVLLGKPALPYWVTLGLNLLMVKIYYQKNADETSRGMMIATFTCMLILLFIFKLK